MWRLPSFGSTVCTPVSGPERQHGDRQTTLEYMRPKTAVPRICDAAAAACSYAIIVWRHIPRLNKTDHCNGPVKRRSHHGHAAVKQQRMNHLISAAYGKVFLTYTVCTVPGNSVGPLHMYCTREFSRTAAYVLYQGIQ